MSNVTARPRPLRVLFHRAPEADPDAPLRDILALLAQGLAVSALRDARAEAEAALGRSLQHVSEEPVHQGPVDQMRRLVLQHDPEQPARTRGPRR